MYRDFGHSAVLKCSKGPLKAHAARGAPIPSVQKGTKKSKAHTFFFYISGLGYQPLVDKKKNCVSFCNFSQAGKDPACDFTIYYNKYIYYKY